MSVLSGREPEFRSRLVEERQHCCEEPGTRVLDIMLIRHVDKRRRGSFFALRGEQCRREHAVDHQQVGRPRFGDYVLGKFQRAHKGEPLGDSVLLEREPGRRRTRISCAHKRAENAATVGDTLCKRGGAQHPYLVAAAD